MYSKGNKRRVFRPAKSQKVPDKDFLKIWLMVDGAVRDCFIHHPSYINKHYDEPSVRLSIVKRVTGQIHGLVLRHQGARSASRDRPPNKKRHVKVSLPKES